MICAAREWEGWKKHRETLRAWTILVSFIVDRMRQGLVIYNFSHFTSQSFKTHIDYISFSFCGRNRSFRRNLNPNQFLFNYHINIVRNQDSGIRFKCKKSLIK